MLPSHLSRMLAVCVSGDYANPSVREDVKSRCIPYLSRHRREVLLGSYEGRHERPNGYVERVLTNARLIRLAVNHAHSMLLATGVKSNVVSFQQAFERRRCNAGPGIPLGAGKGEDTVLSHSY